MPKRVIIVHRWDGNSAEDWYPWLKSGLEQEGYAVIVPDMPNTAAPKIEDWIPFLKRQVGSFDRDTYFVGHSIGVQAILRSLETLPEGTQVGGLVSVAGWFGMNEEVLEEEGALDTAKPWLRDQIEFSKPRRMLGKIIAIFSENDPYAPVSQADMFKNQLGAETVLVPNRGHFTSMDDVTEAPEVLDAVLEMLGS